VDKMSTIDCRTMMNIIINMRGRYFEEQVKLILN